MAFAGLWESFSWPEETMTRSFTILATRPNAEMSELHDRMPVISGNRPRKPIRLSSLMHKPGAPRAH
jgi:putative SOS response-associated peptidase YedK